MPNLQITSIKPEAPEVVRETCASVSDNESGSELDHELKSTLSTASDCTVQSSTQKAPGRCLNFHHLTFWVSNAKQAALHLCVHYGFQPYAYAGLETGSRDVASHVVRQNQIIVQFSSPLTENAKELSDHIARHGDGVRDVAFEVDDVELVLERARSKGATVLQEVQTLSDEHGQVRVAMVKAFGDTCHTFVEKRDYKGAFMPNYRLATQTTQSLLNMLPNCKLNFIDHCVAGQLDDQMKSVADWYLETLSFNRFWSVDDINIVTDFSSLRFIVVANDEETIKMPILEAAEGLKKSQVHEYLDYYGGPGIQHIALHTDDIVSSIAAMEARGVEFLQTPASYYETLEERLKQSKVVVKEDLNELRKHRILLDFDDNGYLLQIFSKPLQDRPTVFIEIIQRRNHNGFGAGNFKALFEAVEIEQAKRGNLI